MNKIVWTFGLIAGAVLSAMMLLTLPFQDKIGWELGALIGYTSMVLAFLMIYFGVRSYRDNVAGGSVKFGRAFTVGLLIALVGTACYVATWEVIYYKLAPDFTAKYAASAVNRVKQGGGTAEQVAAKEKEMADFAESYKNPLVNIAYTAIEPLPVGLIFALGTAGLMSRKRRVTT
jgi:hypothetical protein